MRITSDTTLQQLSDTFSEVFPFLRLEFYTTSHRSQQGSPAAGQLPHSTTLGDLTPSFSEGTFSIPESITVTDFEAWMEETFGLFVQVFRKSSDVWLQTTSTDHWTLKKQNSKGEGFDDVDDIEPLHITDFDVE